MAFSFIVINVMCHVKGRRRFVMNIWMYEENMTGHWEKYIIYQIKEDGMDESCSMHVSDEVCLQNCHQNI
jgi:hypothetical protein